MPCSILRASSSFITERERNTSPLGPHKIHITIIKTNWKNRYQNQTVSQKRKRRIQQRRTNSKTSARPIIRTKNKPSSILSFDYKNVMTSVATSSIIRSAFPARVAIAFQCRRQLSVSCEQSIDKLNEILEEYRAKKWVPSALSFSASIELLLYIFCRGSSFFRDAKNLMIYLATSHCDAPSPRFFSYRQTFPKRFQKDIIKAASQVSSSNSTLQSDGGIISAEGIEHVLQNIAAGHKMTRSEIENIFREIGVCPLESSSSESGSGGGYSTSSCVISVDQMFDLLSKK